MMRASIEHCRHSVRALVLASLVGATLVAWAPNGHAQDSKSEALQILKSMSDYLAAQKDIAIAFNSDIEVITPQLQKIQFASSNKLDLSRPDKLHVSRLGGYADVELFADGTTVTLLDRADKVYAQANDPGSVDQLIAKMRSDLGVEAPGADLLSANVFETLSADVMDAEHVGQGVINGVTCEHLAFRNLDTDWQIWVESGANPIPRKFVITSKGVAGSPQYTLLITDWKANAPSSVDAFTFKEPADAKKIEFTSMPNIDEVPTGHIAGEKQ